MELHKASCNQECIYRCNTSIRKLNQKLFSGEAFICCECVPNKPPHKIYPFYCLQIDSFFSCATPKREKWQKKHVTSQHLNFTCNVGPNFILKYKALSKRIQLDGKSMLCRFQNWFCYCNTPSSFPQMASYVKVLNFRNYTEISLSQLWTSLRNSKRHLGG